MKLFKKLTVIVTMCAMLLCCVTAYATSHSSNTIGSESDNSEIVVTDELYYEYLSQETGFTIKKIKELEEELGVDMYSCFGIQKPTLEELQNVAISLDNNEISTLSSGDYEADEPMSMTQWENFKRFVSPADILVTKDDITLGVNHGHSGLVYDTNTTIEALGYTVNSQYLDISRTWSNRNTVRAYSVPYVNENGLEYDVAQYAYDNLRNIAYAGLPNLTSSGQVETTNCATLVWYAYQRSIGYYLKPCSGSCYPKEFVESYLTEMYFTYGWGHTQPRTW